jgi:hypothetical protein
MSGQICEDNEHQECVGKAYSHGISFFWHVYSILGQRFRVSNPLELVPLTSIHITGIVTSSVLRSQIDTCHFRIGSSGKTFCCQLFSKVPVRAINPSPTYSDFTSNGIGSRGSTGVCSWPSLAGLALLQACCALPQPLSR